MFCVLITRHRADRPPLRSPRVKHEGAAGSSPRGRWLSHERLDGERHGKAARSAEEEALGWLHRDLASRDPGRYDRRDDRRHERGTLEAPRQTVMRAICDLESMPHGWELRY